MSPESPYPGAPVPRPEAGDSGVVGETAPAEGAATSESTPTSPPACTVCDCELERDQTYCLECGAATPLAPKMRRDRGGLAAVAIGLAVLGGGAGALAYVASSDPGAQATPAPMVSTAPLLTVPTDVFTTTTDSSLPGDTTGTLPSDTTGAFPSGTSTTGTSGLLPTDTTAPAGDGGGLVTVTGPGVSGQTTSELPNTDTASGSSPSPGGSRSGGSDDWPAGTSGWTAIVSSGSSEASARAAATRLQSSGQPGGVLFSTDHSSLRPGYWVVFSGVFTSRSAALSHARSLVGTYPGAYPRRVGS